MKHPVQVNEFGRPMWRCDCTEGKVHESYERAANCSCMRNGRFQKTFTMQNSVEKNLGIQRRKRILSRVTLDQTAEVQA